LIAVGLRTLAGKYHPDKPGGDGARMQLINRSAQLLRERLKQGAVAIAR
jgi:hypothetical protein